MTDTFQNHGIEIPYGSTGEIRTLCPECSSSRKKSHEKVLSVNVEKGTWFCNHCGAAGGLKKNGYNKMNFPTVKKTFVKPEPIVNSGLPETVVKWFSKRGISEETLVKNKIAHGTVWMPGAEAEVGAIQFPYFIGSELVNIKYRDHKKNFRMVKGAERVLYGLNDIAGAESAVWVEGECFPGDAEVLTPNGWVCFDKYSDGTVAQWDENRSIKFVDPIAKIKKHFDGELIKNEVKGWESITTPDHNLVALKLNGDIVKHKAKNKQKSYFNIPRVGLIDGPGIKLSFPQIALSIAVSADATIDTRKMSLQGGAGQGLPLSSRYARMGFKKQRKIDRIRFLLNSCGIKSTDVENGNGYTTLCFHIPDWIPGRLFPWSWIKDATADQREFIIEELSLWDGNKVKTRNQSEYASKIYSNALWVQTLCHTSNRCSSIIHRKNKIGKWFKVSILHSKKTSNWTNVKQSTVPFKGEVYCLTVPSGMLVVRQNEKITITGNCDKLSLMEAGFPNCVSVPDGAPVPSAKNYSSKFCFLETAQSIIEPIQKHYIAVDNDAPGIRLKDELIRRIGPEKCFTVDWPAGCKDANDTLVKFGPAEVRRCLLSAKPVPINGLFSVNDFKQSIFDSHEVGYEPGVSTGWDVVDKYYTVRAGEWTVVTGIPGHGKSEFLDALMVNLAMNSGWRFGVCSMENRPLSRHASKLIEKYTGKSFRGTTAYPGLTKDQLEKSTEWLNNHFYFIAPEEGLSIEGLLKLAGALVSRYGIKGLVLDPWNEFDHSWGNKETETMYISSMLTKIRLFARNRGVHVWVVAHPTKLKKEMDGEYPVPTPYDISGAAHWRNKADNALTIHRPNMYTNWKDSTVAVHVQKIRFKEIGRVGLAKLKYDWITGKYWDK